MPTFYLDYENGNNVNDGSTWALAWKTITAGPTAARIAPGDIIRIAKSPDPVSIGNATWTNLSRTVTLASAQTLNIEICETAWTSANGSTTSTQTERKQGSYSSRVALPGSPAADTLYAYKAMSETNFSSYQKISIWIYNLTTAISAGNYKICLCSDNAGAVIVDTFLIPAIPSTGRWIKLTLAREGGGNLGSSIQSVAWYSGAVTPSALKTTNLDNIIACTTNGLNLQSLISKNSLAQGGTETWYAIQSINDTNIQIDMDPGATGAGFGRGYYGTTELVATYKRETIKTTLATSITTQVQVIQDSGNASNYIEFQGGYNIATSLQDGETWFDGLNGYGYGLYCTKNYIKKNYINFIGYYNGIYYSSSNNNIIQVITGANNNSFCGIYYYSSNNNIIQVITGANNNSFCGIYYMSSNNNIIQVITGANNNNNYGIYYTYSNNNIIQTITGGNNNVNYGIYYSYSYNNKIYSGSTANNDTAGFRLEYSENYIYNFTINEVTEVSYGSITYDRISRLHSYRHDNTDNNHYIFVPGGYICSQVSERHTASGIAWQIHINSEYWTETYPIKAKFAKQPLTASNQGTATVYIKKGHATNVGAKLVLPGLQIAGIDNDVTDTKANDTDWEQLSINYTPTKAGVVEFEVQGYYVAGNSDIYFDDVTITQAA